MRQKGRDESGRVAAENLGEWRAAGRFGCWRIAKLPAPGHREDLCAIGCKKGLLARCGMHLPPRSAMPRS